MFCFTAHSFHTSKVCRSASSKQELHYPRLPWQTFVSVRLKTTSPANPTFNRCQVFKTATVCFGQNHLLLLYYGQLISLQNTHNIICTQNCLVFHTFLSNKSRLEVWRHRKWSVCTVTSRVSVFIMERHDGVFFRVTNPAGCNGL